MPREEWRRSSAKIPGMPSPHTSRPQVQDGDALAAIDLGSNSFHMVLAQHTLGQLRVVDRLRETVRMADGLDGKGGLSEPARLRALDCEPATLSAIVVTHEHGDHVGGVFGLAAAHGIPVYLTHGTLRGCSTRRVGRAASLVRIVDPGCSFELKSFRIEPIAATIDAMLADTAAYAAHRAHFGDPPAR